MDFLKNVMHTIDQYLRLFQVLHRYIHPFTNCVFILISIRNIWASQVGLVVRNPPANAWRIRMDRGAWRATVHEVSKS